MTDGIHSNTAWASLNGLRSRKHRQIARLTLVLTIGIGFCWSGSSMAADEPRRPTSGGVLPGENDDPAFSPLLIWKAPKITMPVNVYPAALIDEPLRVIDYDVFRRRLAYDLAAQRAARSGRAAPPSSPASAASR